MNDSKTIGCAVYEFDCDIMCSILIIPKAHIAKSLAFHGKHILTTGDGIQNDAGK